MGGKLVRDRVGELDWSLTGPGEGAKRALRPVKDVDEHIDYLHKKILEEAGELIMAASEEEVAEEAADLIEAVKALCAVRGVHHFTVETRRLDKLAQRGGFTEGLVWDV